jgi:hypothetical protein
MTLNLDMLALECVSYLCPNLTTTGIGININANANAQFPPPLVAEVLHADTRTDISILISNSQGS